MLNINQLYKTRLVTKKTIIKSKNTKHGKLVYDLAKLHLSFDTKTDTSECNKTQTFSKHEVQDDEIFAF